VTVCCDQRLKLFAGAIQDAKDLESILYGELPAGWEDSLPTFTPEDKGLATRLHSQTMLNALASAIPGELHFSACSFACHLSMASAVLAFPPVVHGLNTAGVAVHGRPC
jgi:transketolase